MERFSDAFHLIQALSADPATVSLISRAINAQVVLDTWMHGPFEETITPEAESRLSEYAHQLGVEAAANQSVFPRYPMPESYSEALFKTTLTAMALYQLRSGEPVRIVDEPAVTKTYAILRRFVESEPLGLTAVARVFGIIWMHEDLNALIFYKRMERNAFLAGGHRPGNGSMLAEQLKVYHTAGLVREIFTGGGDMLEITDRGQTIFVQLHRVLEEAGELDWRANQQRWLIFHEMHYDTIIARLSPDTAPMTDRFLKWVDLQPGQSVLEVGAGTGRVTIEHGLYRRVQPGGRIVALDPSTGLLQTLMAKCQEQRVNNVETVTGRAESLPFADNSFDVTVAVASLHFTDIEQSLREIIRVTKPGGQIAVFSPTPAFDLREVPMMSLWLRPLSDLADRFNMPFGDHNGLAPGQLETLFRTHLSLTDVTYHSMPWLLAAEDHRAAFIFFVKGAALYQNILARLPLSERWAFLQRLEERGDEIAAHTTIEEKRHIYKSEAILARVR